MSIQSGLAKLAPKAVVNKAIDKGNYKGDNWATVSTIIQAMCGTRMSPDGKKLEFIYKGKAIGWAKQDGTGWIDDNAYKALKKEFRTLPDEFQEGVLEAAERIA